MSSTVQPRKPKTKKMTSKNQANKVEARKKPAPSLKYLTKNRSFSESEESSLEEEYLKEYSTGESDNLSCESEDISQEFTDEDELMEYYEKKLREHCLLGNIDPDTGNDDSEGSDIRDELEELISEPSKSDEITKQRLENRSPSQIQTKAEFQLGVARSGSADSDAKCSESPRITNISKLPAGTLWSRGSKQTYVPEKQTAIKRRDVFQKGNVPVRERTGEKISSKTKVAPGLSSLPTPSSYKPKPASHVLPRKNQGSHDRRTANEEPEGLDEKLNSHDSVRADILKNYVHNFASMKKPKSNISERMVSSSTKQLKEEFVTRVLRATLSGDGEQLAELMEQDRS